MCMTILKRAIQKNEKGTSLVQILVVVGVMSILNLGVVSVMQTQSSSNHEMNMKTSVLAIRQNLVALIGNQNSWNQTYAANLDMRCYSTTQQYCNPNSSTDNLILRLMDANGGTVLSPDPTAGFTALGEPCNQYSPSGNDTCPIRVEVSWHAQCTASTCSPSVVASGRVEAEELVSIKFSYSPKSRQKKYAFNPLNYNLVQQSRMRLQSNASPAIVCGDQGKIFIGINKMFNGHTTDPQGCIVYNAFVGPQGPQGPMGPMGPTGPMGPAGSDATCP